MKKENKKTKTTKPTAIYRKDYKRPDYQVDDIDLDFDIKEDDVLCTAKYNIRSDYDRNKGVKPLFLDGDELDLESISLNGKKLEKNEYKLDEKGLTIQNPPKDCLLEIKTNLKPKENKKLQGLYESDGILCTKCETLGFRRITFYPDRPDVMARYTTTIKADKEKLPKLLSNGNLVEEKELGDNRHMVKWHDPNPKPSYLFAVVAGNLERVQDKVKYKSGREVELNVWTEPNKSKDAKYCLKSMKEFFKWDEKNFKREYDLSQHSVVSVSNFNSGACENTSLNIFNDKYALASSKNSTDYDFESVEGVTGHEAAHFWSGNKVTIANWFNLSLKEGLTVYRDQEFSSDMRDRDIKRIEDANVLRNGQYPEDAGPMAHPVRPDSYISPRNVYTGTVYNKGAEVIRMQEKVLGKKAFNKGLIHYFDKFKDKAVTCDDFVKALEESSKKDLSQFLESWYSQAGTPTVKLEGKYNKQEKTYELKVQQNTKPTPEQKTKKPFIIPLEVGLIDKSGRDMVLELEGEKKKETSKMLVIKEKSQTFKFNNVKEEPVLSANRGFTSPVNLKINYSDKQRAHLMKHDSDIFNRWDAGQEYAKNILVKMSNDIKNKKEPKVDEKYINAIGHYLKDDSFNKAFVAMALSLPNEKTIAKEMKNPDFQAVHEARKFLSKTIANKFEKEFFDIYEKNQEKGEYSPEVKDVHRRALKNTCLNYISNLDNKRAKETVLSQYKNAENMEDRDKAIKIIANKDWAENKEVMNDFYNKYKDNNLVVQKWFSLQASSSKKDTLDRVKELTKHEAFDIKNPNIARSVIGVFANNQLRFNAKDGSGYDFVAQKVIELDKINPQIAANLAKPLGNWQTLDEDRKNKMLFHLRKISKIKGLSPNTFEVCKKSLDLAKEIEQREKKSKEFNKKMPVKKFTSGSKAKEGEMKKMINNKILNQKSK